MNKSKIEWTERTWNPVPNFEGYYASADGCILSKRSHQPRIMNPMKQKDGYLYVYLYDGYGNQKKMYVHRLVLMSWVGMPKDGQECRHLNDDPSDNRIENLFNMRKAIDARKSKRIYTSVLCACGCGNYLTTPDNRGRERRFIQRHYNWWRYKENNQNNSKNEQNKN